jgi:hypothetical protein
VLVVLAAESAWAFGWNALVAIGTLAAAIATGTLAFFTWRLAKSTQGMASKTAQLASETAEEITAGHRPVIVPVASGRRTLIDEAEHGWTLRINIKNAGAGPASFVRALHDPSGVGPRTTAPGSLAPGEEWELVFYDTTLTAQSQVLLDYRDLSGRTYSSAIIPLHPEWPTEDIAVQDVKFGRDVSFTGWGEPATPVGLKRLPIDH